MSVAACVDRYAVETARASEIRVRVTAYPGACPVRDRVLVQLREPLGNAQGHRRIDRDSVQPAGPHAHRLALVGAEDSTAAVTPDGITAARIGRRRLNL